MKKLMIAACAVAFAAAAQAATCVWNFQTASRNTIYGSDLETEYTGTAYTFMITDAVTQDSVLKAALNGDDLASIAGTKFALDVEDGAMAKQSGFKTTGSGSDDQKWFLAIVQDDKVYISDFASGGETTLDTGTTIKFVTDESSQTAQSGSSFTEAGWYSAVPEPTSGLLLLLGVAGLALRRRRA